MTYGGGTVDILYKLTRALMKRGHQVTICTGDYKLDRDPSFKYEIYPSIINIGGIRITPNVVSLDVRDYDIIHFHCYRSFMNYVLYKKAIKHGVPYIIDAHGSTVDMGGIMQPIRKLYDLVIGYKALDNAKVLIAETSIGLKEYERLGVRKYRVMLQHPLFDMAEFENLPQKGLFREKYGINEKHIVLFLGRIHWAKGLDFLVNSVKNIEDAKLVIVGQDDGYKKELMKLIPNNMEVLFTGYLSGVEKLSVLVDADVLIQPSRNEAGARPSLEAVLCNTPAIVTRNTGAGIEVSQLNAGYLVNYGDTDHLERIIRGIFKDGKEASDKVRIAKEYIRKNLSMESQVMQYEKLYEEKE
jgi:glycosyltransferase involved in cell wall biosynthesis